MCGFCVERSPHCCTHTQQNHHGKIETNLQKFWLLWISSIFQHSLVRKHSMKLKREKKEKAQCSTCVTTILLMYYMEFAMRILYCHMHAKTLSPFPFHLSANLMGECFLFQWRALTTLTIIFHTDFWRYQQPIQTIPRTANQQYVAVCSFKTIKCYYKTNQVFW